MFEEWRKRIANQPRPLKDSSILIISAVFPVNRADYYDIEQNQETFLIQ